MASLPGDLSDELIAESVKVLFVGSIREKLKRVGIAMHEHYTDYEDLSRVMAMAETHASDAENTEHAIAEVANVLGGEVETAREFVQLRKLEDLASDVFEALRTKAIALEHGDAPESELVTLCDATVSKKTQILRKQLAEVSGSPPFVCNIAIGSFVKTLGHHLGLAEHRIAIDLP
jgi:hypothetical protein